MAKVFVKPRLVKSSAREKHRDYGYTDRKEVRRFAERSLNKVAAPSRGAT
jgi:hypothetical protein